MCSSPNSRILYIDDDKDSCELISLMLQLSNESYEITAFTDPERALVFMGNQPVALFILDYALPGMSGVELCRRIRQIDKDTPIVFYSGMARKIDRDEAMAAGATEYLVKPNDLEGLSETVQRLLNKSQASSNSNPSIKPKAYDRIY